MPVEAPKLKFEPVVPIYNLLPEMVIYRSVTTPINYINSFGATAALKYIYRNEHLHTTANVFYNEGQGTFNFEVVPWEKKTADITFD